MVSLAELKKEVEKEKKLQQELAEKQKLQAQLKQLKQQRKNPKLTAFARGVKKLAGATSKAGIKAGKKILTEPKAKPKQAKQKPRKPFKLSEINLGID